MEKKLNNKKVFILLLVSLGLPFSVYAYEPTTTHAGLSQEIVSFYNLGHGRTLTDTEKELVIQGSIDEDTPRLRVLNHFYDPIRKVGIEGYRTSKEWATNGAIVENEFSWPKVIQYYAEGDEQKAFIGLGHILHLIEDVGVPDHTRNDPHIGVGAIGMFTGTSPFEDWTNDNKNRETMRGLGERIFKTGEIGKTFGDLGDFFDFIANYSNKNFFSKDSIKNAVYQYQDPKVSGSDENYVYGFDPFTNQKVKLLGIFYDENHVKYFALNNKDDKSVLSSYFDRLSKQIILSGSGVVDLFLREAGIAREEYTRKKKQEQELQMQAAIQLNQELSNASAFGLVARGLAILTGDVTRSLSSKIASIGNGFGSAATQLAQAVGVTSSVGTFTAKSIAAVTSQVVNQALVLDPTAGAAVFTQQMIPVPATPAAKVATVAKPTPPPVPPKVAPPPPPKTVAVVIPPAPSKTKTAVPAPSVGISGFGGGATPTISASTPASATPTTDTTPPDVSISVSGCVNSNTSASCVSLSSSVSVSWSSTASDVSYYILNLNGTVSTTTATSAVIATTNNSTYSFAVSAVDVSGNHSATSTELLATSDSPIVINEIAWGGTNASTDDEWIELYNKTDSAIDLSGWMLYAGDLSPYLPLSGTISARGYYLIKNKSVGDTNESTQSPIVDVTADLWTSFGGGFEDTGEDVFLVRKLTGAATTTIDQITNCYNWCSIGPVVPVDPAYTMTRIDPDVAGTDWANWITSSSQIRNGTDRVGNLIMGTPRARNYVSYLVAKNAATISSDLTLKKNNSPYLVDNTIQTINTGVTLTIEPGVVVKFNNPNSRWDVYGTLHAVGTSTAPIVFTSNKDDTLGGDIMGDGSVTTPANGDWEGIHLYEGSGASAFDYVTLRYGAYSPNGTPSNRAMMYVENVGVSITHSTFDGAQRYGLSLVNSTSTVTNNTFKNVHDDTIGPPAGLSILVGAPTVSNNVFQANYFGLSVNNSTSTITNNTFTGNTTAAFVSEGRIGGTISGNSGSGNGVNGIIIAGVIVNSGMTTTLAKNGLPYIITPGNSFSLSDNATVSAGATLSIDAGVTFKLLARYLDVSGTLLVNGTADLPVSFTAESDDSDGNDAQNNGATVGLINFHGVKLEAGSSSTIQNAVFNYMDTAIKYFNPSPIDLQNVVFENSNLGINAASNETILRATNVTFSGNTATSTIQLP